MAKKKVGTVAKYGISINPRKYLKSNKMYDNATVQKLQSWAKTKFGVANTKFDVVNTKFNILRK